MPRRKLSEYRAKVVLSQGLGVPYVGWSISDEVDISKLPGEGRFVLKVDQAQKRRFKNGLVLLNLDRKEVLSNVEKLRAKGYEHFIVEPHIHHESADERYLSLGYDRKNFFMAYSPNGGVDIEAHPGSVKTVRIDHNTDWDELGGETALDATLLKRLVDVFRDNYFTFLEVNPYIVVGGEPVIMDAAVEVDDAGAYFAAGWNGQDLRSPVSTKKTDAEETIARLDEGSAASFNFSVLNPDGSIFLLLSGGGASVVVADEIHNRGFGKQMANYGEYSGNPTAHETYLYARAVLDTLLASKARKKVLFIGGAVANFTDIANTFSGIIQALNELVDQLSLQDIKVFVRRGGPRQEIGLSKIRTALETQGILGAVDDPSVPIDRAVGHMIKEVSR